MPKTFISAQQYWAIAILALASALLPELALAAPNDYTVDQGEASAIVSGARSLWVLVANVCLYGGIMVGVGAYVLGLGTQWIRYAAAAVIFGAVAEPVAKWIFEKTDMTLLTSVDLVPLAGSLLG